MFTTFLAGGIFYRVGQMGGTPNQKPSLKREEVCYAVVAVEN